MVGLAAVLTNLPWATIFERAPGIVDGAAKLMQAAGLARAKIPEAGDYLTDARGKLDKEKLSTTFDAIESSLRDLNDQIKQAGTLISDLAVSNQQLAAAVKRQRTLLRAATLVSVVSIVLVVMVVSYLIWTRNH